MRGSRFRVYINPFNSLGSAYTGYVEVTDYVDFASLASLAQDLDNADFSLGIFRVNNISLTFRNETGRFSDVGASGSMFLYTRGNSKVKITWSGDTEPQLAGWMVCGSSQVAPETTIFEGLLNDENLSMDLDSLKVTFSALGLESILNKVEVPALSAPTFTYNAAGEIASIVGAEGQLLFAGIYDTNPELFVEDRPIIIKTTGSLGESVVKAGKVYYMELFTPDSFYLKESPGGNRLPTTATSLTSGYGTITFLFPSFTKVSDFLYFFLNQAKITNYLTISEDNIDLGFDPDVDNIQDFTNKRVFTAASELLLLSNSVLYVVDGVLYIAPRTPDATVAYDFYGPASTIGIENIQTIKNIKSGLSRVFNVFAWDPSKASSRDATSVNKYGARTKQISTSYVTYVPTQEDIMDALLAEFKDPKQEFELYAHMNYDTLQVSLLDRVRVDYPAVGNISAFVSTQSDAYKVIGRTIDTKKAIIKFKLRKI